MNLKEEDITHIKNAFSSMKSKNDFLELLNYAKIRVFGKNAIPFELKQLTYYVLAKKSSSPQLDHRYTTFEIKKKSGAPRTIHAPKKGLKAIQQCLNVILQTVYESEQHIAAYGFIPGKSIVDNAKTHTGSNYVYNIDLKDFFSSIDQARVWGRLRYPPFNLGKDITKIKKGVEGKSTVSLHTKLTNIQRQEIANIIASLCCQEMEVERVDENGQWQKVVRNVLPQGAPTSPILTNIICQQLDFYLSAVAKRFGLRYSRYADDITFSSMHNAYNLDSKIVNDKGKTFREELVRIIGEQHFIIKESKTRLQKEGYRQEVTGLLVNSKVNVQKRYIKELRMWLYYWERYGYQRAEAFFSPRYVLDKGYAKKGLPNLMNVIAGKLDYLRMVKGAESPVYFKLKERFDKLTTKVNSIFKILDVWESEGIEKAMELFYGDH